MLLRVLARRGTFSMVRWGRRPYLGGFGARGLKCTQFSARFREGIHRGDEELPEGWRKCFDPGSKRPYFHDTRHNVVSWAHPESPEDDVFANEIRERRSPLMQAEGAIVAPLTRRLGATLVDVGASFAIGGAFGGAVYADLGDPQSSAVACSFALWGSFIFRDAVLEQGTRSLGKRVLGLEVVTNNGRLPARRHTIMRNLNFIAYGAITAFGDMAPLLLALACGDLLLFLFSPGKRKLGDFIGGTKVISECSDRPSRLAEKRIRTEEMMSRG